MYVYGYVVIGELRGTKVGAGTKEVMTYEMTLRRQNKL